MSSARRLALPVDLLILDLDGTLIDSVPGIVRAFRATLAAAAHPDAAETAIARLIGLPLEEMFLRLVPSCDPAQVPELVRGYRERYAATEVSRLRAFPGVVSTLGRCRAAGVSLAVATSKHTAVATRSLEAAGLLPYIGRIVGDDLVARKKPHPEMVHRLLAAYGLDPAAALLVGDTTHDLEMGRAAGLRVCAVTYGVHDRAALAAAGPDLLLDRFDDLLCHVPYLAGGSERSGTP